MVTMQRSKFMAHDYKGGRYRPENTNIKNEIGETVEIRTRRGNCQICGGSKSAHFMEG